MESTASPSVRLCLVCGSETTSCHYEVDVCRACTVFYRRALKKTLYPCRSNNKQCTVTQDISTCK
ncbi:hypothetical protein PENTCL1PPCAC_14732, partial [Pristionchus entomophagus]